MARKTHPQYVLGINKISVRIQDNPSDNWFSPVEIELTVNACFGLLAAYHYLYLNVRFQYKADIRVDSSERLLSSESGHSVKPFEQSAFDPKRTLTLT